ncbi:MAG: methyl-accepting chemotaxis protein [Marinomonas sp.]
MLSNLSFRTKLIILLSAAITGFIIVTIVALEGFNTQTATAEKFDTLTKVDKDLASLTITLMEEYEASANIDDGSYKSFLNTLNSESDTALSTLDNNINAVTSPEGKALLNQVKLTLTDYDTSLEALIHQKQTIGFNGSSGLKGKISLLGSTVVEKISFLSLIKQEFLTVREAEKDFIFEPTNTNKKSFMEQYKQFYEKVLDFGLDERFGDIINQYFAAMQNYDTSNNTLVTLQHNFDKAKKAFHQSRFSATDFMQDAVQQARQQARVSSEKASVGLIIVSLIVAISCSIMMISIGRNVNKTLNQIIADLSKIKSGDLTARLFVNHKRNDEFDSLCRSVNDMSESLDSVITDVAETTKGISGMVVELNSSVTNIASSNQSVSAQTSSLAAATEEISTTISSISITTDELSNESQHTYESAKVGAETINGAISSLASTISIVNQTSLQLNELGQLSQNIDAVIGMINDLASQTNLLALNAAIEAARAGEAGRGFSVVADEVRSLAEKTVDATAKITTIVGTIQTSTQTAIETMHSGQESLHAIESFSEKAGIAIREIEKNAKTSSASSTQMAHSIQEVAKTATHMSEEMDQIAQQLQQDNNYINNIKENTQDIHNQVTYLDSKTSVFTTTS